ncbi:hypothetical protein HMN09_00698900 [Mycena chlorophos]|uniref:Non-specific serine/threonine protein kinase n=1 Tax=Mycena chlorophos TaxID=658473 RepID=A0A8H6WDK2_MYCCL|nr:hypothetical protein HMN09_00698900 [Mycena chlorophos]
MDLPTNNRSSTSTESHIIPSSPSEGASNAVQSAPQRNRWSFMKTIGDALRPKKRAGTSPPPSPSQPPSPPPPLPSWPPSRPPNPTPHSKPSSSPPSNALVSSSPAIRPPSPNTNPNSIDSPRRLSYPPVSSAEHRNAIRAATLMLCNKVAQAPVHLERTGSGRRDWEEVEVRMRALVRLARMWRKTGGGVNPELASSISDGGEERERRLFAEALRDGFVLCQLVNKLRPISVIHPDRREDGYVRTGNVTKFLEACSSSGVPKQDLFLRDDLIEATSESLARVARTIIALVQRLASLNSVPANQKPLIQSSPVGVASQNTTPKRDQDPPLSSDRQAHSRPAIRLGKGKWPDDFIDTPSAPFLDGNANEPSPQSPQPDFAPPGQREPSPDRLPAGSRRVPVTRRSSIQFGQRSSSRDSVEAVAEFPAHYGLGDDALATYEPPVSGGRNPHFESDDGQRRRPRPTDGETALKRSRPRSENVVNLSNANPQLTRDPSGASYGRKMLIIREEDKPQTHLQLGNCIGRGQFGSVYRALNLNTGQLAAVKRIRLERLSEQEITQLMRQLAIAKSLSHPNIVKYQGLARDEDTLSIVLEYAENGSLGHALKAFGKLNERLVASYVVKILEGLHYLHSSDVVHCDLKAANILTTKTGNVKLSDFGVPLNLWAMEGVIKDAAGTQNLNWVAPEVIELKGASPKSDIWSLACTIVELLTGRPPYAEIANSMSVMFRIVEDDMPPLPENCSPSLEDFLRQCFNKNPAERPSAELLGEHEWLKNTGAQPRDLRPQDSIPFLRRVGADLQKSDAARSFAQLDVPEPPIEGEVHVSSSPPGRRVSRTPLDTEISSHDHAFVKTTFSKPMVCRVCLLNIKKSAVLCEQCTLVAHSKCAINAPRTCDLHVQLLLYAQYAENDNAQDAEHAKEQRRVTEQALTQLLEWHQVFEAQTKERIVACTEMDDGLMQNLPSESAETMIYQHLVLFVSRSTQDVKLQQALGLVANFVASLDPVWSFVQSAQLRVQLLKVSSLLNISDGEQLRAAVAKDELALGMLLRKIVSTEREKKRFLLLKGESAQCAVDLIQDILDKNLLKKSQDAKTLISNVRRLLVKLAEASDALPASLFIRGVVEVDKEASFGGAFGDIYRASHNGRDVALKRMRVHVFQRNSEWHNLRRRFYREALLWQRLQHPFVLPFTGIDTETFPSFFCIVSPWMAHGTILKHLAENGNANVERRLLEIAQGLSYLHSQSVVHGDLRGSNILVDDNWQVRLADFGLGGFSDATVGTQTSHRGGSARWMSPELHLPQSCGLDSFQRTFASDAYSFACVCLELSQGKAPFFEIKEDMAVVLRVLAKERPARPEGPLPDSMWEIMQQCWAHDPGQRPSMARVVEMLQETLNTLSQI